VFVKTLALLNVIGLYFLETHGRSKLFCYNRAEYLVLAMAWLSLNAVIVGELLICIVKKRHGGNS